MDLICYSHLRWNFVYQRPQHLIKRFTSTHRVFYVEEPCYHNDLDTLNIHQSKDGVWIVVPLLQLDLKQTPEERQIQLLTRFFKLVSVRNPVYWYYTPMALGITPAIKPSLIIYDCMDELSAFLYASGNLKEQEQYLFDKADLVFTGGKQLFESKRNQHESVYLFPSAIDKEHFNKARKNLQDPSDQSHIKNPRFGFFGVIDERFHIELIREVALRRPDWHFILVGPIVKIDPDTLPKLPNIFYLGSKKYDELPYYISTWDIALIPFALNDSTKFISPTKTPEYLAAGKPVISTAITDVVEPYGVNGLVEIIENADEFIVTGERLLKSLENEEWLQRVDQHLALNSWDATWQAMSDLMDERTKEKEFQKKYQNHV